MLRWLFGNKAPAGEREPQGQAAVPATAATSGPGDMPPAGTPGAELKRLAAEALSRGQTDRATDLITRVLAQEPNDADAHLSLGKILLDGNQFDAAAASFQAALQLKPDHAEAHFRLGKAWQGLGRIDEAMASYQNAVKANPKYPEAHNNLGVLQHERGNIQEAIHCYQRAVDLNPNLAPARFNLSLLQLAQGRAKDALQNFERAIALDARFGGPQNAEFHYNLGLLLSDQGQQDEAMNHLDRAIAFQPGFAIAHRAKGTVYRRMGQVDSAIACYRKALSLDPNLPDVHNDLGVAFLETSQLAEATQCFQRAFELAPKFPPFINNVGMALAARGNHAEAIKAFQKALAIDPNFFDAHSNLLFYLSHDTTQTPESVFAAHRAFGDHFERPLLQSRPAHTNSREPDRALRIGFVSADLRAHAVASFIEPLWLAMDKSNYEIWVYANHAAEDAVTARLKKLSRNWRNVANLADAEVVDTIRNDQIDILFDLSGHTFGNRLLAFAHKPAPVQVTWIGNPNTTGLQAMDYYLADRFSAPPGLLDAQFTEKIVRLPSGVLFQPFEQSPAVNPLPALQSGRVTFGSFSRGDKLVGDVASLWARVLAAVPGSQMLVGGAAADQQARVAAQFAANGVEASRLIFVPRSNMADYLAAHHRVDMILDTFPFNGGTTTCHAAWMGVPVLTIAGKTMASRVGVIINSNLGLTDFIAVSEDDFVAKATSWATRPQDLAALRGELRDRMAASPFCQPQKVARWVEAALRTMWQRWCAGKPAESFEVPR